MFKSLDYAFAFWRLGLSVIPVPRPDSEHNGKRPKIPWKRFQSERASEGEIRRWFAEDQNIAIITGLVSGVVVVDSDTERAEEWARWHLPRTPWRVRTAKGWHRYYRHPGVKVANKVRIGSEYQQLALDVRGDGGFVIGPGSVHESGARYEPIGDWTISVPDLPAFQVDWVARPHRRPRRLTTSRRMSARGVVHRARQYLAAIPRPIIGQGADAATFRAACRLVRGFRLDPEVAADLLLGWTPDFDRWWIETKVDSAVRYGQEAEGGLLGA